MADENTKKKGGRKPKASVPVTPGSRDNEQKQPEFTLLGKRVIVIPYFAAGAQGRELEYAVSGWRRHFKEPYHIIVVGDYHPICDTGEDITFIECPRIGAVPATEYRPHLDMVNKFAKVMELYPELEGFIYACDDMYAVNDFDMVDVLALKQREPAITSSLTDASAWKRDNARTRELLKKEGLPYRNYICHLPVYYETKKLKEIYDKYDYL